MNGIVTIGYEAADLADFLATLKKAGVDLLLDIRELPMSRRRGFSKTALKDALAEVGIDYRHERELGSPRDLRNQLREDHDYDAFFAGFRKHIKTKKALLEQLASELDGTVALLCYERNYKECHRKVVAESLQKLTGQRPRHIGVVQDAGRKLREGTSLHSGKGVPAV